MGFRDFHGCNSVGSYRWKKNYQSRRESEWTADYRSQAIRSRMRKLLRDELKVRNVGWILRQGEVFKFMKEKGVTIPGIKSERMLLLSRHGMSRIRSRISEVRLR